MQPTSFKKQIFINLPVSDLHKSTEFYEKLGFVKNPMFSNDTTGNSLAWSEEIILMLLTKEYFQTFIDGKNIPDAKKSAQVGLCINLDSKEAVDKFANTAEMNGGRKYQIVTSGSEEFMYGFEVEDLDGNWWEPIFMDISKFPKE